MQWDFDSFGFDGIEEVEVGTNVTGEVSSKLNVQYACKNTMRASSGGGRSRSYVTTLRD